MEQIILQETALEGLRPIALQVMVHQYFFADVFQRDMSKNEWVRTVLFDIDKVSFFPDGESMRIMLDELHGEKE